MRGNDQFRFLLALSVKILAKCTQDIFLICKPRDKYGFRLLKQFHIFLPILFCRFACIISRRRQNVQLFYKKTAGFCCITESSCVIRFIQIAEKVLLPLTEPRKAFSASAGAHTAPWLPRPPPQRAFPPFPGKPASGGCSASRSR